MWTSVIRNANCVTIIRTRIISCQFGIDLHELLTKLEIGSVIRLGHDGHFDTYGNMSNMKMRKE